MHVYSVYNIIINAKYRLDVEIKYKCNSRLDIETRYRYDAAVNEATDWM